MIMKAIQNPTFASQLPGKPLHARPYASDTGTSQRVSVKVEEGETDDIPDSIKRSFRERKSLKEELERQRDDNDRLRAELFGSRKETADAISRLDGVKESTKKSLESASRRLAELNDELASLRSQSNECFAFAEQARSALPDISDLRSTLKESSAST
ncbi:hypothetical protein BC834DRAFT_864953 [Gloeopeniophorella convolvens]|nr:hypothetical protein BC834DRAFT_864953 [Gloeopeniophorella convolvens]